MRVWIRPLAVLPGRRIAPMRPSIMSLGATMSTPASACVSAWLHQHLDGLVVQDVTCVVQQAVLAVAGEGVQRHVGHHAQFGEPLFQLPHHDGRHQAVGVPALRLPSGFSARRSMTGNSAMTGMPSSRTLGHRQQQVQAQAFHAGHGGHGLRAGPGLPARTPGRSGHATSKACSRTRLRVNSSRRRRGAGTPPVGVGGVQGHGENCARVLNSGQQSEVSRKCTPSRCDPSEAAVTIGVAKEHKLFV